MANEDMEHVDKMILPGRMASPFYEGDFGPHPTRV